MSCNSSTGTGPEVPTADTDTRPAAMSALYTITAAGVGSAGPAARYHDVATYPSWRTVAPAMTDVGDRVVDGSGGGTFDNDCRLGGRCGQHGCVTALGQIGQWTRVECDDLARWDLDRIDRDRSGNAEEDHIDLDSIGCRVVDREPLADARALVPVDEPPLIAERRRRQGHLGAQPAATEETLRASDDQTAAGGLDGHGKDRLALRPGAGRSEVDDTDAAGGHGQPAVRIGAPRPLAGCEFELTTTVCS